MKEAFASAIDGIVAASLRMQDQEEELQQVRVSLLDRDCRIAELELALRRATDMLVDVKVGIERDHDDRVAALRMVANRSRLS